ncbi:MULTISPECIES: Rpp14/Pop5 family protein [Metallosphaera]|uniref:Ribonuclease P protein component 2 n=3 Tax=Metallosphaera TaxID=41980 RepID=A4YCU8_METS5|nr:MULTISPECIES: Rpp14/Pop5 family protein [Metallosphaera]ABP94250.1 ribonuclease P protein subunit Rpp14 [Metallosphaera sedula DSM 5348]AIM26237.1 ribonuclease P protein subunit Rpp14 [Metallosphaera sedula]MCY0862506.1 ribonuclease P [Metallosphaera prunae]QCO30155.1 ribonuclease P [Metallosphaera prunae]WPX06309.1 Rpp14/Pop5 family protein [Metallosphaera sedula DSM 5348]
MYQTILDVIFVIWLLVITILLLTRKNVIIVKSKRKVGRNKRRYIVFRVVGQGELSPRALETSVREAVKELVGRMWLEISDPHVIFYNPSNMSGIISTNRLGYRAVLASMPLVKSVSGTEVLLVPFKTTGSLKKAKSLIRSG